MSIALQEQDPIVRSADFLLFVRRYGPEHISSDKTQLRIMLNNHPFDLKLTNVGGVDSPVHIAWLDTHPRDEQHPDVDVDLPHASAEERARLIAKIDSFYNLGITTIVAPESSKSTPAIIETVEIASGILKRKLELVILPGGKDEARVLHESVIPPVTYQSVTSSDNKFMGVSEEGIEKLFRCKKDGSDIMLVDDVFTKGGTLDAMQKVLNKALHLPDGTKHPLVVVATESVYGQGYPTLPRENVFSCIHLPEFIGGLPSIT